MRDNFSAKTKKALAEKAGHVCSYPQCRIKTHASNSNTKSSSYDVGQAAHITAAAPGGPRYDATLTSKERSDESNGIWLCYTHAKLIDSVAHDFSKETLRTWKKQHEKDVNEGRFNAANTKSSRDCRYIQEVKVEGLGPFANETVFRLGRLNFIVGNNGTGKTALTQMACWFAGGLASKFIRKRFLRNWSNVCANLEIKYGERQDFHIVHYSWHKQGDHLVLDANTSSLESMLAVQSSLRALIIDDDYGCVTKVKRTTGFRHIVAGLAGLIGIDLFDLLSLVSSKGDRVTAVGYKLQLSPNGRNLLVERPNSEGYHEYFSLSRTEQMLATFDIALRCVDLIPPSQSWLFIIENYFVDCLFSEYGQKFSDILLSLPVNIQLMACSLKEQTVLGIIRGSETTFTKCSKGPLALWTSHDAFTG